MAKQKKRKARRTKRTGGAAAAENRGPAAATSPVRRRANGRGRPPLFDGRPSREVAAKRLALAGPGGDPAKTAAPIDLLETRRWIAPEDADAGRRFALLRFAVFGPASLPAFEIGRVRGTAPASADDPGHTAREAAYRAALASLTDRSARVRAEVIDLCIHDAWPLCLRARTPAALEQLGRLQTGLTALAAHFRRKRK